jgi:electron transfer flavoprotein alpha subunit
MTKGVLVLGEHSNGELCSITFELLTEGKKLARKIGAKLVCVILGQDMQAFPKTLGGYGADEVLIADEPCLREYAARTYVSVLREVVTLYHPEIFLFGSTPSGREIAPMLAAKVGAAVITDCNILDIDSSGRLVMTKFVYNGQASVEIACDETATKLATIQPGMIDIDEPDYSRVTTISPLDCGRFNIAPADTKVIDFLRGDPRKIDLSEARIVVAGGRGMADGGGFKLIEELADAIDGSVGGSRVAADKGWIPHSRQVGLSGRTTTPELFVACGISGAVQFLAGMKNSKNIIAINKDRYAPIFSVADLKILGDVKEVLPPLVKELHAIKKNNQPKAEEA